MVRLRTILATLALSAGLGLPISSPAWAQSLHLARDVAYAPSGTPGGDLLVMDVYRPSATGRSPALVLIHGGGFFQADKSLMDGASRFFAENGYVVFNINYRLAPEFPYPAAVKDAQSAVRFIRAHSADYGVDPSRIGAMGGSAGATIAASLAADSNGHFDSGSGIAAAVCLSPALDMSRVLEERSSSNDVLNGIPDYIGMPGKTADFLLNSSDAQKKMKAASPYYQVEKGDPPLFVANALHEFIPIDQTKSFVAKLRQLGITHTTLFPPSGHAMRYFGQARDPALSFFDQYVRDYQAQSPSPSPSASLQPTGSPFPIEPAGHRSSPLLSIVIVVGVLVVLGLILAPVIKSRRLNR